jgi:hypothetical protein
MRTRRTQPAFPGATAPTTALTTQPPQGTVGLYEPKHAPGKRTLNIRRSLLVLPLCGLLLEVVLLALFPLLANGTAPSDPANVALLGLVPWLPRLYWTRALPGLVQLVAHVSWLNPLSAIGSGDGAAHLLLILLFLAIVLTLLARSAAARVLSERLTSGNVRAFFVLVLAFTVIFGITLLFAPGIMSQDIFLYGLFGRLVTLYHLNPYTVSLAALRHDAFQQAYFASIPNTFHTPLPGPVWLDLCIPVTLLAHDSLANVLIGFRLMGLAAHLANAVLIWLILTRFKPETRLAGTLLYAWNPLVLLLSINGMHLDIFVLLLILLAIVSFQHNASMLAWVFLILALLINPLCLLMLPLFLRLLAQHVRTRSAGGRILWWLAILCISVAVIVLAYVPYWQGWGPAGLLISLQHLFLQDRAVNSLDAALLNLPVKLPAALVWLFAPQHWTLFAAIVVGCLLLLGLWLADSLKLVVLFSSWIWLALFTLLPLSWPWYALLPFALALCSANRRTVLLALLLVLGATVSTYALLWQSVWPNEGLLTIGLAALLWGWILFFDATWEMTHGGNEAEPVRRTAQRLLSRPSRTQT